MFRCVFLHQQPEGVHPFFRRKTCPCPACQNDGGIVCGELFGYDMGIPNHTERHLRIEGDAVELAASWGAVDIDVFLPVPNEIERDAVGASRGCCHG